MDSYYQYIKQCQYPNNLVCAIFRFNLKRDYDLNEFIKCKGRNIRTIEYLLNSLTPKEADILKLRFGYNGYTKTLKEIGQMYGITKEYVRQIEAKALSKLRHPARTRIIELGIPEYIDSEIYKIKVGYIILLTEKNIDNIDISYLDISNRVYNCLKRANINYLSELLKLTDDQLTRIRNLGPKSFRELKNELKDIREFCKNKLPMNNIIGDFYE